MITTKCGLSGIDPEAYFTKCSAAKAAAKTAAINPPQVEEADLDQDERPSEVCVSPLVCINAISPLVDVI